MNIKRKQQQDRRQAVIMAYTALKYSELHTIATDGSRSAQERTKALYKAVRGYTRIRDAGSGYIESDGRMMNFTSYNLIDITKEAATAADLIYLAEDLTQAYYTNAGGRKRNTMDLINAIQGTASPYYYS